MRHILEQKSINLPRMIMNYMWEATTKKHLSLPYGMVLTQLFKEFRVPNHEDDPKRALRHTDVYNLATLKRMGFHKVNNEWTRKFKQIEKVQHVEKPRNVTKEAPRVSSPVSPQAQQSDLPSTSSSSPTITEEKLMSIVNSMIEDLKEYMYES